MTPLMLAVATDHADPRTVRLLLQHGADIGKKDRTGLTAAGWAKKYNSSAILREFGFQGEGAGSAGHHSHFDPRQAGSEAGRGARSRCSNRAAGASSKRADAVPAITRI
jgi:hypothetical protein